MMAEDLFWTIVDTTRKLAVEQRNGGTEDVLSLQEHALATALERLTPSELIEFNTRFWDLHHRAYRWDLWAVAYWLDGGCSDDGFTDFRASLISLGKSDFYAALADPDSLADVVDRDDAPYMQSEGFQYVAIKVYQQLTGSNTWPDTGEEATYQTEPAGEPFDFEDQEEMSERFPRIVRKFPEGMG